MQLRCNRCQTVIDSLQLGLSPCTDWDCPARARRQLYAERLGQQCDAVARRVAREQDRLLERLINQPRLPP